MKSKLLFGGLASLSLTLAACTGGGVNAGVTGVTFAAGGATQVAVGSSTTWTVNVATAAGSTAAKTFTCASSNTAVATVAVNAAKTGCTITGVAVGGPVTITATSTADTTKKATAQISVVAAQAASSKIDAGKTSGAPTGWSDDADATTIFKCFVNTDATGTGSAAIANVTSSALTLTKPTTAPTGGNTNYAPDSVYNDERYCASATNANLRINVPVTAGATKLRLHFVEAWHGTTSGPTSARQMTLVVTNGATASTAVVVTLPLATATTKVAYVYDVNIPGTVTAAGSVRVDLSSNGNGDPTIAGLEVL